MGATAYYYFRRSVFRRDKSAKYFDVGASSARENLRRGIPRAELAPTFGIGADLSRLKAFLQTNLDVGAGSPAIKTSSLYNSGVIGE